MELKTLVQVLYDGDDEPSWDYSDGWMDEDEIVSTDESLATLEDLVAFCDQKAESVNAHDFCGTHRLLGAVLYQDYGRESATKTMLRIAKMGGLHSMSGVCSENSAFELLKVGQEGHDWDGSYDDDLTQQPS